MSASPALPRVRTTTAILIALISVVLLGLAPPVPASASSTAELPWLKTSGNRIVTADTGQDVVLRGANVLRSEWDVRMDAERRAIPALAAWKGNVIVRGFASDPVNAGNSHYLAMLDEHVSLAAANRMYVVFAWRSHTVNGPQPASPDDRAQRALATLAKRYSTKSNVMYALQVEPHDVTWAQVQPRFVQMVDAIRAAASPNKPIVMIPGTSWGRDVSGALSQPVSRENIVYKTHPYNNASHFQKQFLDTYNSGKPVFIGEFGYLPDHGMHMSDVQSLIDTARSRGLGWAAWAFDFQGNPGLVKDNVSFVPSVPYGAAVHTAMLSTMPAPYATTAPAPSPTTSTTTDSPTTSSPDPIPTATPATAATATSTVDDTTFSFSGVWNAGTGAAKFKQNDRHSARAGDRYTIAFTGSQASVFARVAPWHGRAAVSVDGGPETTVDLYASQAADQTRIYQTPVLANGPHLVTVRVTGTKNPASGGTTITADRADIVAPALPVQTVNDNSIGTGLSQFSYTSGWSYVRDTTSTKHLADDHYTAVAGSVSTVRFRGTQATLYGSRAPWHGIAMVSVNGGPAVAVDYYGASRQDGVRLYSTPVLPAGDHVLTIRAAGTRSAASSGTTVTVDRVDVAP